MPSTYLMPVEPNLANDDFWDTASSSSKPQGIAAAVCRPISSMPATRQITGRRGSEFWAFVDLENVPLLQAILKEEVSQGFIFARTRRSATSDDLSAQFQRPEPADEIHYIPSRPDDMPPQTLYRQVSLPCLRDCLVFLYRGAIFIQEEITETGHAYAVENEEWLTLSKDTTIFVMEEGAMKGICKRKRDEKKIANRAREEAWRERVALQLSESRARREALEAKRNKPWNKLLRKLRRESEPEKVQCATQ